MALCKDKAIATLNKLGFDVVRFPRSDIAPLDIIVESSGSYSRLASLPSLFTSEKPVPVTSTTPASNLNVLESSELRGAFGLQAIVDIFSKLSLSANAKRAKSVRFIALEPVITKCVQADMEDYVSKGQVNTDRAASRHFFDDRERIYLITQVISSKKLKIVIGGDSAAEANAAAAEITQSISASGSVGTTSSTANEISYEQSESAVFGFASAEIYYDDGWLLKLPRKTGKAFLGSTSSNVLSPETRIQLLDSET